MIDNHDTDPTDEELSAWLDGELDADHARQLGARVAATPELAQRYAALAHANVQARAALRSLDQAPLPDSVLTLLDQQDAEQADGVIPLKAQRRFSGLERIDSLPLALAAGVALVVGFLAALLVGPMSQNPGEPAAPLISHAVVPGSSLHTILQTQLSGSVVQLPDRNVVPVQTFETAGGTICREVHASNSEGRTLALACRHGDGWLLRMTELLPSEASSDYQTASSTASAVAGAVERLKAGAAMDPQSEAELLKRWSQR